MEVWACRGRTTWCCGLWWVTLASDSAAALGLYWPPRDEDVVAINSRPCDTDFFTFCAVYYNY
ncbi:hypothetical protein J6590_096082 [Homalodisca vitripennis]|nr:hypothetical protein J6590_096082 [Homalodisca vitripennis]